MRKIINNWKRSYDGFTIIELMIVVAIIGVLAAIAIPRIHKLYVCSGHGRNSEACRKQTAYIEQVNSKYNSSAVSQSPDTITVNGVVYQRK